MVRQCCAFPLRVYLAFRKAFWSVIIIIIIIIIIIGKDTISFMQGLYTYIPETNYVPKE
jgi:hypothetical protein